jgi:hypothetical protein
MSQKQREHIQKVAKKPPPGTQEQGVGFHPLSHVSKGPEEAFEPGWVVERNPGLAVGSFTDKRNRVAAVPLGGKRAEEIVRLHEAEHLTATDLGALRKKLRRSRVGISDRHLRMLEEIRVNGRLTKRGFVRQEEWQEVSVADGERLPEPEQVRSKAHEARTLFDAEEVSHAIMARARLGLPTVGRDGPMWARHIEGAARQVFRYPDDWRSIRRLAKEVKSAPDKAKEENTHKSLVKALEEEAGVRSGPSRRVRDMLKQKDGSAKQERMLHELLGGKPAPGEGGGDAKWGDMTTTTLPLHTTTVKPGEGRKWRTTDQPTSKVTKPHRLMKWGDRLGFKRRPKKGGTGSFLMDCSGSMSWTPDQILKVLDAMPRSNIGLYSGRRSTGQLVIVAKGGKRATRQAIEEVVSRMGHSNVVDGPALRWLAKQPEPRVWVSDGLATEIGDGCTGTSIAEAAILMKRAKAKRVEKPDLLGEPDDE